MMKRFFGNTIRLLSSARLTGHFTNSTTASLFKSPPNIALTQRAIDRIRHVNSQFGTEDALRVRIDSGGCHGFQYHFEMHPRSKLQEDDIFFDATPSQTHTETPIAQSKPPTLKAKDEGEVRVIIDAVSYPYLDGVEIDYVEELIGSSFKIASNPNASSECGCKISFQAK